MQTETTEKLPASFANLMTISAYAKMRGVSRQTIYNWISDKKLTTQEVLGTTYVDKSSLKG